MTTSTDFNTDDDSDESTDGREGVERQDWERDVLGDTIEEEDERLFAIVDREFEDGIIKSDHSVRLDKME